MDYYLRNAEEIASSIHRHQGMDTADMLTPKAVQMSMIVISVVPIMLVYPWAQKYFTKGIMMGAVKG